MRLWTFLLAHGTPGDCAKSVPRPVDPDGRETLAFSAGVQRYEYSSRHALFEGRNNSPCKEFNPAGCRRNGNEQLGEALTIHLLHAESVWNYPAFFDYVDRWMTEDDTQAVAEIKAQTGFDYSADWERQGQTRFWLQGEVPQYTFIDDMWTAYRQ